MKRFFTSIFIIITFFQTTNSQALDLFKGTDFNTVKVDNLSNSDVAKIKAQLDASNLTFAQAEALLISKGMSNDEVSKLKTRLYATPVNNAPVKVYSEAGREQEKVANAVVKTNDDHLIFGSELFDNPTLNFEPNLKIATPVNYILGPGDELQIGVFGVQIFNATLPVSVEGKIDIPNVGQIAVIGMTIEAATQKIKSAISNIYVTLKSGQSQLGISLSKVRTIKITVIGGKQPGNYSVSSLSTVYNALYVAGGPGTNGSYRNIELIRNNVVYKKIDIYRFLVNGDQSDNVGLKDNDVIRIPFYTNRVTLAGEVKRPGIFEMKPGESFQDLVTFASGFNEVAYTAAVNAIQKTDKEYKVIEIKSSEFKTYRPLSGDEYRVAKILNRFENRIKIFGAVFRPDTYSFYEGMKISDLIQKADGLKEDAYTTRAKIIRVKSDLTTEMIQVNLKEALSGNSSANILLQKEDVVNIYSILEFIKDAKVTIDGEINKPGDYLFQENLTLNDLLIQAGGILGSSSKKVEIARMVKSEEVNDTGVKAELFNIELSLDSNEQAKNFELKPFDVVTIRRLPVYEIPESVNVTGAVNYTGKYVLVNKKEKVYDIIKRAGGLAAEANIDGVKIYRPIQNKQIEELQNVNLKLSDNDSLRNVTVNKLQNTRFSTIPVDWRKISKNPNNNTNITLLPGDEIEVVRYTENIKVSGNVLLTSEIPFEKGKGFGYYLGSVGGTDAKAWKKKAFIIYPNGKTAVSSSFLFMRSYPKVLPGSQIVIPEKPQKKNISTGEFISTGSILISLAVLILTAFR